MGYIGRGISGFQVAEREDESEETSESEELNTFRSRDVDEALEKAQQLMKFKHDKDFINKVLDAQIRVNEIEQSLIKNATHPSKGSTTKI